MASELRITSHQLLTNRKIKNFRSKKRSKSTTRKQEVIGLQPVQIVEDVAQFCLVGNSVSFKPRIQLKNNFKINCFVHLAPDTVHAIFVDNNNATGQPVDKVLKSKVHSNSGGVHSASIRRRKDLAREEFYKKRQKRPPRRRTESLGAIRIPIILKSMLYPNNKSNFHNFPETPLFTSTEEARYRILKILGSTENFRESTVVSEVHQTKSNYIEEIYDFLYDRHLKNLYNILEQNSIGQSGKNEMRPSNQTGQRKSLHIHQNCFYDLESQSPLPPEPDNGVEVETLSFDFGDEDTTELTLAIKHFNLDTMVPRV